jgi:hypothetical protein
MTEAVKLIPAATDEFWARVDKTGDCWVWTGSRSGEAGYGRWRNAGAHTGHDGECNCSYPNGAPR